MTQPAMHEDLSRRHEPSGSSDRSFALVCTVFFLLVGLGPAWRGRPIRLWAIGLAAGFLAVAVSRPRLVHPLNRLWTRLGLVLGRLVSPIVTGAMFYLVFGTAGLLLRFFGWDPLRLRWDPGVRSYWIERRPPGPPPGGMANQF